jgi:hypothetical protein
LIATESKERVWGFTELRDPIYTHGKTHLLWNPQQFNPLSPDVPSAGGRMVKR